jgi:hypothetical protein
MDQICDFFDRLLRNHAAGIASIDVLVVRTFSFKLYTSGFEFWAGTAWKSADRKVILDWARIDPVEKSFSVEKFLTGKRSRQDEIYRRT